ncbi:hypothetical protein ABTH88_19320, partial [Acinetobacter baumannii]
HIVLTPKADVLIADIEAIAASVRNDVLTGIDESEQALCQQVLLRILANLEKRGALRHEIPLESPFLWHHLLGFRPKALYRGFRRFSDEKS